MNLYPSSVPQSTAVLYVCSRKHPFVTEFIHLLQPGVVEFCEIEDSLVNTCLKRSNIYCTPLLFHLLNKGLLSFRDESIEMGMCLPSPGIHKLDWTLLGIPWHALYCPRSYRSAFTSLFAPWSQETPPQTSKHHWLASVVKPVCRVDLLVVSLQEGQGRHAALSCSGGPASRSFQMKTLSGITFSSAWRAFFFFKLQTLVKEYWELVFKYANK